MSDTEALLEPSSSSLATSIAAAFNIVRPQKMMAPTANPTGALADEARKYAQLVGECAKIIHDKITQTGGAA